MSLISSILLFALLVSISSFSFSSCSSFSSAFTRSLEDRRFFFSLSRHSIVFLCSYSFVLWPSSKLSTRLQCGRLSSPNLFDFSSSSMSLASNSSLLDWTMVLFCSKLWPLLATSTFSWFWLTGSEMPRNLAISCCILAIRCRRFVLLL